MPVFLHSGNFKLPACKNTEYISQLAPRTRQSQGPGPAGPLRERLCQVGQYSKLLSHTFGAAPTSLPPNYKPLGVIGGMGSVVRTRPYDDSYATNDSALSIVDVPERNPKKSAIRPQTGLVYAPARTQARGQTLTVTVTVTVTALQFFSPPPVC